MPQILKAHFLEKWTGGVQGIVIVKPDPPGFLGALGIKLNADQWLYFFALGIAKATWLIATLPSASTHSAGGGRFGLSTSATS